MAPPFYVISWADASHSNLSLRMDGWNRKMIAEAMVSDEVCKISSSGDDDMSTIELMFQYELPLDAGDLDDWVDQGGRIRLATSCPLRRTHLFRYLHRFRDIFRKGIELSFQSNYWQGSYLRSYQHSLGYSIDPEARTLTLAIGNQRSVQLAKKPVGTHLVGVGLLICGHRTPNHLRLETWILRGNPGPHLLKIERVLDTAGGRNYQAASTSWLQFLATSTYPGSSFRICTTNVGNQYWDAIACQGGIVVLCRRRRVVREEANVPPTAMDENLATTGLGGSNPDLTDYPEDQSALEGVTPLTSGDSRGMRDGVQGSLEFEPCLNDDRNMAAPECSICNQVIVATGLRCTECREGGFYLCKPCFEAGCWCNGPCHAMGEAEYNGDQTRYSEHSVEPPQTEETLSILDTTDGSWLFEHQVLRSCPFDSVPTMHPQSQTVAWYLAGDQILFAQPRTGSRTTFCPKIGPHSGKFPWWVLPIAYHRIRCCGACVVAERDGC